MKKSEGRNPFVYRGRGLVLLFFAVKVKIGITLAEALSCLKTRLLQRRTS